MIPKKQRKKIPASDWIAGAWVGFWSGMAIWNQKRQTKWEGLRFLQYSRNMWICVAFAALVLILHIGRCNKRRNGEKTKIELQQKNQV